MTQLYLWRVHSCTLTVLKQMTDHTHLCTVRVLNTPLFLNMTDLNKYGIRSHFHLCFTKLRRRSVQTSVFSRPNCSSMHQSYNVQVSPANDNMLVFPEVGVLYKQFDARLAVAVNSLEQWRQHKLDPGGGVCTDEDLDEDLDRVFTMYYEIDPSHGMGLSHAGFAAICCNSKLLSNAFTLQVCTSLWVSLLIHCQFNPETISIVYVQTDEGSRYPNEF